MLGQPNTSGSGSSVAWPDNSYPNPSTIIVADVNSVTTVTSTLQMAPDTSLQPFVNASASTMALATIPTSPRITKDMDLHDEQIDPDAKLILSDFTQSSATALSSSCLHAVTEYFPMDLYRSIFFIGTLDLEYNRIATTIVFLTFRGIGFIR